MITSEEIKDIAMLSKLSVSIDELDALTRDFEKLIEFADEIKSAPTVTEEPDGDGGLSNVMRKDEVQASLTREEILSNADGCENGFFTALKK